jgi:hypothetical protein
MKCFSMANKPQTLRNPCSGLERFANNVATASAVLSQLKTRLKNEFDFLCITLGAMAAATGIFAFGFRPSKRPALHLGGDAP